MSGLDAFGRPHGRSISTRGNSSGGNHDRFHGGSTSRSRSRSRSRHWAADEGPRSRSRSRPWAPEDRPRSRSRSRAWAADDRPRSRSRSRPWAAEDRPRFSRRRWDHDDHEDSCDGLTSSARISDIYDRSRNGRRSPELDEWRSFSPSRSSSFVSRPSPPSMHSRSPCQRSRFSPSRDCRAWSDHNSGSDLEDCYRDFPSSFSDRRDFSPTERYASSGPVPQLSPPTPAFLSSSAPPPPSFYNCPRPPPPPSLQFGFSGSHSVPTGVVAGLGVNMAPPLAPQIRSDWPVNTAVPPPPLTSAAPVLTLPARREPPSAPNISTPPINPGCTADSGTPTRTGLDAEQLKKLIAIREKKPWMTEKLFLAQLQLNDRKAKYGESGPMFIEEQRHWYDMMTEAKSSSDSPSDGVSTSIVHHLLKQRCRFLRCRNQLEQRISQMNAAHAADTGTLSDTQLAKTSTLTSQNKVHMSLKVDLSEVCSVIERLDSTLRQLSHPEQAGIDEAEVRKLLDVKLDCVMSALQDNVEFLVLGDESVRMLSSYRDADNERASFHTGIDSGLIALYSSVSLQRPDQEHCMNEVLLVARRRFPVTVLLLASSQLLHVEGFSAGAAARQLVALAEQLRMEGVYRVVIVGVTLQLQPSAELRARWLHEALQSEVRAVGGSQLLYQPITATDEEFGQPDHGTACKNLYKAVHLSLLLSLETGVGAECVPVPARLTSIDDAITATDSLIDANGSRLAMTQTQRLRHIAELLRQLRHLSPVREHLSGQNMDEEDAAIYFTDPSDHVCLSCNKIFESAKLYLQHLLGEEHKKKDQETGSSESVPLWRKNIPVVAKKQVDAKPVSIKGLDMLVGVHCWYCKVCNVFIGDLRCASSHLKSRRHNSSYQEYLNGHPGYQSELDDCRGQLLCQASSIDRSTIKQNRQRQMQERSSRLNSLMRSRTSSNGLEQLPDDVPFQANTSSRSPPRTSRSSSSNKSIKLNLLQEHISPESLKSADKVAPLPDQESSSSLSARNDVGDVGKDSQKNLESLRKSCIFAGADNVQQKESVSGSAKRQPLSSKSVTAVTKAAPIIGKMPCRKVRPPCENKVLSKKATPELSEADRAVLELAARQEEEDEVQVLEDSDDCDQDDIQLLNISRDDVATSRRKNIPPPT